MNFFGIIDFREVFVLFWNEGVWVIVFGVGNNVNVRELRLIVEWDEDVILVMRFDDLVSKVNIYVVNFCEVGGKGVVKIELKYEECFYLVLGIINNNWILMEFFFNFLIIVVW